MKTILFALSTNLLYYYKIKIEDNNAIQIHR